MADRAGISRRRFLAAAGLAGVTLGGAAVYDAQRRAIDTAFHADPGGAGSLRDIDHFVLLMQENRSFDHYFGSMSGVRGFDDHTAVFRQRDPRVPGGRLLPFHLDTHAPTLDADIVNDPAHGWGIQHAVWNDGRLDRWMVEHGPVDGRAADMVMGYYTRSDLPVHYALADAFTVCDHYFSSVLGPTAPNRLYWMTAGIDPEGADGGPAPDTVSPGRRFTWPTFPELLQEAGVSWKIYNHPNRRDSQLNGAVGHFAAYRDPASPLHRRGIAPQYPQDFLHDVRQGTLPSVSWIIPAMSESEHPAHPAAVGADGILQVLTALTARPQLWERTALVVSYDENGGLFDHVPPPTPPPGTPGEYLPYGERYQPIGLGFRVPCLVISPYTRGGNVCSDVMDHTSQLQLLGARFGLPVPNLTPWRRSVTSDMTSLFRLRRPRSDWIPEIATEASSVAAAARSAVAGDQSLIVSADAGRRPGYTVQAERLPAQESSPPRRRLSS